MNQEHGEVDYLALTKPVLRSTDFRGLVEEAYALDCQCFHDHEIAKLVGRSSGRISQILNEPSKLNYTTVLRVTSPLKTEGFKKAIEAAWRREVNQAKLNESEAVSPASNQPETDILRQIDEIVWSNQPETGLALIMEALKAGPGPGAKWGLLNRAFQLHQRMDQTGKALQVAHMFLLAGVQKDKRFLRARGLAMYADALRRVDGSNPAKVDVLYLRSLDEYKKLTSPSGHSGEHVARAKLKVQFELIAHKLKVIDRQKLSKDQDKIAIRYFGDAKREIDVNTDQSDSLGLTALRLQVTAQIHLWLEEFVAAEELLDAAFNAKSPLPGSEIPIALVQAQVLARREQYNDALKRMDAICKRCEEGRFLYLLRCTQREMAAIHQKVVGNFLTNQP